MGYAEMLMNDAVQAGREQLTGDLQHILDAAKAGAADDESEDEDEEDDEEEDAKSKGKN